MNYSELVSERVKSLPSYIFSQINEMKAQAISDGKSVISLAIGDPDQPTPQAILDVMKKAIEKPSNHAYSPYEGTLLFRESVTRFCQRRFGISLDAKTQVIALIGSKEGIAHFPLAFCNPGDRAVYPSPGYPVFESAILLAGGQPIALPLRAENQFLPDPEEVQELFAKHQPKFCILNFPSNPTSVVASKQLLTELVALARRYGVILVSDNAYSEIYFDGNKKPISLLEIPGAEEIGIEFHSLSKTFNMTGWRLGFAIGNAEILKALLRVKTNIDSGPLLAVQETGSYALDHSDELADPIRQQYYERRTVALKWLGRLGVEYLEPQATFYVWAKVPQPYRSMEFCQRLIAEEGLVITPGIGFGLLADGFFRISLTVDLPELEEAFRRLERFLKAQ